MTNINFEIFLGNLSFVILFLLMISYWVQAIFSIIPKFNVVILFTTLCVNISLFLLLIIRWLNYGHFPLSNLYESLIFLSWSFTLIQLIFLNFFSYSNTNISKYSIDTTSLKFNPSVFKTQNVEVEKTFLTNTTNYFINTVDIEKKDFKNINGIIGIVFSPITLFTHSFATFSLPKNMQRAQALVPALQSNWLMMHVTVMMLSYAALLCGSLLAISFLIITWQNPKTNNQSQLNCLVSIEKFSSDKENLMIKNEELPLCLLSQTLDNLSYRILGIGFPLLTIGILSGAVWANEAWGSYWSWDPKETWAFITWLVFAIYLHARITKGWKGKKPAILASFGFIVVWICYLGVNILGNGLHSYGWIKFGG